VIGQSIVKSVEASPLLSLPDKPSIAVLPFANMSGDPEQEYFADGMVEEIITALSRVRWLFVIARNSTFTYKGRAIDVKQVGRELGVRYVLEGSVRKAASRVRITAQLIDALSGTHLWADRFDGSLEDVFELQENVAVTVAGVIEPTLQATEIHRASKSPTRDLTAYDLYLRALASFPWSGRVQLVAARDLLDEAIERDPLYAPAIAWSALPVGRDAGIADELFSGSFSVISYAKCSPLIQLAQAKCTQVLTYVCDHLCARLGNALHTQCQITPLNNDHTNEIIATIVTCCL
jgi:TolB-like protein